MNDTADAYRMNPAEDTLVYGDELKEGMWVLAGNDGLRYLGRDEDNWLRAQRFRRVTRLRREHVGHGLPDRTVFLGEWVDGYQQEHRHAVDTPWIVKKTPTPEVSATVSEGDLIRVIAGDGQERVMVVARVEDYVITLADVPAEGEGQS